MSDVKELKKFTLDVLISWRDTARKRIKVRKGERQRLDEAICRCIKETVHLQNKFAKITKKIAKDREWIRTLNDVLIKKVLHG